MYRELYYRSSKQILLYFHITTYKKSAITNIGKFGQDKIAQLGGS